MTRQFPLLPYTSIVGQERLKLALELTHVAPRIGGVLIRGQRGTGKTTAARAFAMMVHKKLPVTLPINATEDRVVGGLDVNELMQGKMVEKPGLLEQANGSLLFIDEVNLLDDHIVNIILDVTSTGILTVQREGQDRPPKRVSFALVGTMNPDEGELRPQLLDRFGLVVTLVGETDSTRRRQIIETVMAFDQAVSEWQADPTAKSEFFLAGERNDTQRFDALNQARAHFPNVTISSELTDRCIDLAVKFKTQGHRADYLLPLAARACAALAGVSAVDWTHVKQVAPLVLSHRRSDVENKVGKWDTQDDDSVTNTPSPTV